MKRITRLLILFLLVTQVVFAQSIFKKVTSGAAVSAAADSRSVNWVDVNGDGVDDLFISNGLQGGQNNMLYINDGSGSLNNVFNGDIVEDNGPSDGATFADADNDGDLDGFVVTWYGAVNSFYRNNGDGTFNYEADQLTANLGTYSEAAAWGDYDNDGFVDVFIANSGGSKVNMLYRNLGNGSFERITTGLIVEAQDISRNGNWVDYDNDGDVDLFVVNENDRINHLYRNDGNGNFTQISSGALTGTRINTMGASWGDIDNDGDQDVFVANANFYQPVNNQLFRNDGNDVFTVITLDPVVTDGGCSFGSAFGDVDNDGDLDLAVANGFCNGEIRNFLYLNDGQGNFSRATDLPDDFVTPCSFGAAFGDFNHDGFLDLAVANCKNTKDDPEPRNFIFENLTNDNNWLKVRLEGTTSNRAAIGAKVRVKATVNGTPTWQMREVTSQSGYCGQNSLVQHFGLAEASKVDSIVIEWPSGNRQVLEDTFANQQVYVVESGSVTNTDEAPFAVANLRVFPNPIRDQFQLEGTLAMDAAFLHISLIDTLGSVVFERQLKKLPRGKLLQQIKIGKQLPNGVYYLRLAAEESLKSMKVVIEN